MKYINRHIEKKIERLLKTYKTVLITGARQVGKTKLLMEKFNNINYITMDDYSLEDMAKSDSKKFLLDNGTPIIIDEVQRTPELFRTIKLIVDKNDSYGQYLLSGSQLFKLMEGVSESLAGRIAIIELGTLSFREIIKTDFNEYFIPTNEYITSRKNYLDDNAKKYDIWSLIHRGFYPELQNPDKDRNDFYYNYVNTYIERDIREIINVKNLNLFYKFMVSVAARTGQLLNYSNIASDVGVDAETIKSWISILETSNIIYLLKPFSNSVLKRTLKTPKLYFRDTGLCSYLTKWLTKETLQNGALSGAIFETFVISEIIKSYSNVGLNYDEYLSFYNGRDNKSGTQSEIDLIIELNGTIHPIEIKTKSNPDIHDIKNFEVLEKVSEKNIGEGAVICSADNVGFINDKVSILPYFYI